MRCVTVAVLWITIIFTRGISVNVSTLESCRMSYLRMLSFHACYIHNTDNVQTELKSTDYQRHISR